MALAQHLVSHRPKENFKFQIEGTLILHILIQALVPSIYFTVTKDFLLPVLFKGKELTFFLFN